jgi:hypothetical protein
VPRPTVAGQLERLVNRLESPNVLDSNFEVANIVDVIDRHARATFRLAQALDNLADAITGRTADAPSTADPSPS